MNRKIEVLLLLFQLFSFTLGFAQNNNQLYPFLRLDVTIDTGHEKPRGFFAS